jgi:uncharacterized membrane protein
MRGSSTLTVCVLVVGLVLNSIGNGLLSAGMKRVSLAEGSWVVRILSEPRVLMGVALQAMFFASYLFALSRADLSFVLPLTAIDYLLTAAVAAFVLGERPPFVRWAGIGFIAFGVGLVLATNSATRREAAVPLPAASPP